MLQTILCFISHLEVAVHDVCPPKWRIIFLDRRHSLRPATLSTLIMPSTRGKHLPLFLCPCLSSFFPGTLRRTSRARLRIIKLQYSPITARLMASSWRMLTMRHFVYLRHFSFPIENLIPSLFPLGKKNGPRDTGATRLGENWTIHLSLDLFSCCWAVDSEVPKEGAVVCKRVRGVTINPLFVTFLFS